MVVRDKPPARGGVSLGEVPFGLASERELVTLIVSVAAVDTSVSGEVCPGWSSQVCLTG